MNRTAREVLVEMAGEEHALHTVLSKAKERRNGALKLTCSCGSVIRFIPAGDHLAALRNVPDEED